MSDGSPSLDVLGAVAWAQRAARAAIVETKLVADDEATDDRTHVVAADYHDELLCHRDALDALRDALADPMLMVALVATIQMPAARRLGDLLAGATERTET